MVETGRKTDRQTDRHAVMLPIRQAGRHAQTVMSHGGRHTSSRDWPKLAHNDIICMNTYIERNNDL